VTLIVIPDPADRERQEARQRRQDELHQLVKAYRDREPTIVMTTTCPTCGRQRYVPVGVPNA